MLPNLLHNRLGRGYSFTSTKSSLELSSPKQFNIAQGCCLRRHFSAVMV